MVTKKYRSVCELLFVLELVEVPAFDEYLHLNGLGGFVVDDTEGSQYWDVIGQVQDFQLLRSGQADRKTVDPLARLMTKLG